MPIPFHLLAAGRRVIFPLARHIFVGFAMLCAGSQLLHAQQDLESSVPANWAASSGTLSISPNHYKMGSQSLRWNWNGGSVITISNPGITAADVTNPAKSTCDFWVWNGTAIPGGKLRIEFMNGSTAQYWFDFNLDYAGWRHAVRSYVYDMGKVASPNATFSSVRITAPAAGSGSFYLDSIRWVGDSFTRIKTAPNAGITGSGSASTQFDYMDLPPDIPAPVPTSQELADLETARSQWLASARGSAGPDVATVTSATSVYNALNITDDVVNGIRGNVLTEDMSTLESSTGLSSGMVLTLACDYSWNTSTTAAASGTRMSALARHFLDQGIAAHSDVLPWLTGAAGYDFRNIPNGLILAAPAYDATTRARLWDFLRWSYLTGKYWQNLRESNTDNIHTAEFQFLGAILWLTPNDAEAVRWLKGHKRHIEIFLTPGDGMLGGIKPDSTGFHHAGHYNNYMYALTTLSNSLYVLRGTGFQIDATAYSCLADTFLAQLHMSVNGTADNQPGFFANSLCGRKPFTTKIQCNKADLRRLGEWGGAIHGQAADAAIARAYNRRYGVNEYPLFAAYGVDNGDGFYQFNYSPLGIHRRANWVASIHSTGSTFWSSEIYATENRYGRYQAYGALEVMYDGGLAASGQQLNGYDWNQPPGTTTIVLPDAKLIASAEIEMVRSQIDFSCALAFHDGRSGLYASNFQEKNLPNHNPSFVWRKSWFAFDNEIVCLGSDIANNDAANPTVTTLFQGAMAAQGSAITLDGSTITNFPYSATASGANAHWLLDAQGTGFITQPGANVKISRATQTSANHSGSGAPSTGDFSKAWFDHGNAPAGAGYEYAVIPGTTAAAMASAASNHSSPTTKPYQVIERDSIAHIVKWKADGKIGYAIFSSTALPAATRNAGLLNAVQRPCLVMTQPGEDIDAWLTVVDPDLNLTDNVSVPRTLDLTLNGRWILDGPPAGASVVSSAGSLTVIRVTTSQGAAVHLHLIEAASGYYTWIAGYNPGAKQAPNDDADQDGIQNLTEFVLGTAPDVPNPATLQSQKSGNNFVFTFSRADASELGNLQVVVEAGTSLQTWRQVYQIGATTDASSGGVTVAENGSEPDTVTVNIPVNGTPACFARLKITAE